MTKNLAAVILGTRSGPRLKTPIPLLEFGETTVLNRTLSAYLEAGFSPIVLVLGQKAGEIRESLGPLGDRVEISTVVGPDERFADSLRAGLDRLTGSIKGFALGLGDQPLLQQEVLADLAARFAASKAKILVPSWHGHLGFPLFLDASLAPELRRLEGHAGTWEILKSHAKEVEDVEVGYVSVIRNITDLQDYHDVLRMAGLPVPEPRPPAPAAMETPSGNGGPPAGEDLNTTEAESPSDEGPEPGASEEEPGIDPPSA